MADGARLCRGDQPQRVAANGSRNDLKRCRRANVLRLIPLGETQPRSPKYLRYFTRP